MGIKLKINNIMHLVNSILKLFGYYYPIDRKEGICNKRGVENLDSGAVFNFAAFDRRLGLIHSIVISKEVS